MKRITVDWRNFIKISNKSEELVIITTVFSIYNYSKLRVCLVRTLNRPIQMLKHFNVIMTLWEMNNSRLAVIYKNFEKH